MEDAHFVERARQSDFEPRTLEQRQAAYPTGTFNRRASELHPSETDFLWPGAWDKVYEENRDLFPPPSGVKPVQFYGRKKLGALRPTID